MSFSDSENQSYPKLEYSEYLERSRIVCLYARHKMQVKIYFLRNTKNLADVMHRSQSLFICQLVNFPHIHKYRCLEYSLGLFVLERGSFIAGRFLLKREQKTRKDVVKTYRQSGLLTFEIDTKPKLEKFLCAVLSNAIQFLPDCASTLKYDVGNINPLHS